MSALTDRGEDFDAFSMLQLNELGQFIEASDGQSPAIPIDGRAVATFLKRSIVLPLNTTDVFVWIHGWQNDAQRAADNARRLFKNLTVWFERERSRYPRLGGLVPAFVAVHWPSVSLPGPIGYRRIRERAKDMTTKGHAALCLASLLGYLDADNSRTSGRKPLQGRGGYYVLCIGHSFGGRFLAAAINVAATPSRPCRSLLAAVRRETGFAFTVDSLCVLQMAAPARAFGDEFSAVLDKGPLSGPIVLTHSIHDRALCLWHKVSEWQSGIGCRGAIEPAGRIGAIALRPSTIPYSDHDFAHDITNVDASAYFTRGGLAEEAHSDFWQEETLHLIASIAEQVR